MTFLCICLHDLGKARGSTKRKFAFDSLMVETLAKQAGEPALSGNIDWQRPSCRYQGVIDWSPITGLLLVIETYPLTLPLRSDGFWVSWLCSYLIKFTIAGSLFSLRLFTIQYGERRAVVDVRFSTTNSNWTRSSIYNSTKCIFFSLIGETEVY